MPYFMTMGLMGVFVSLGTAYSLAKSYKLDGLTAAMLSLTAFLLAAAPQIQNKMSMDFLGGEGVFTAIICALWSVELIHLLKKYNITIKMPEQVPPAIARSFELLYPVIGIMITVYPISLFLQSQYGLLLPAAIMQLFQPLVALGDTLPAILIALLIANLLWFAGIHGDNIVTGLLNPIFMANLATNAALMSKGMDTTQILTAPYWSFYICVGGSGSTLVLAFLYLRSRAMAPWTTPAPIGAMISAAWDYRAFILVIVLMVIDTVIWYPFFKAYEKQLVDQEIDTTPATANA
jgi:PTS system cellobiose-specific IIC component